MSARRGRAALLRSTALVLACALASASAEAGPTPHRPHRVAAVRDPSPFDPGDDSRDALSRLVAEPDAVLKAYAPTGASASQPSPEDRPRPTLASTGPELPTGSVSPPRAAPASAVPAEPERPPVAGAAKPSPDPLAYGPVSPEQPVLDAATLERALAAWVGPEPVAGRKPPAAEARRRAARLAIQHFYADRGFAPLWVVDGQFDAPGRAVLSRIDRAAEDALDLRDTPVAVPHGGEPDALAAAELSLSEAAADYARQASGGRVDPARIGETVAARPDVADPVGALGALRDAADPGLALLGFNPPHAGYAALRAKLAEMRRAGAVSERDPIPAGPALKPGMRDARVPLVRARFGLDISGVEGDGEPLVYDTKVASAVADYQRGHGLPASGVLTARTVASLSGGQPQRLEDEIASNMERWRWLPRDLGERYIAVNVPDFSLDVVDRDRVVHHARVVVGKPDHETPIFSETMKFIIVNPYWNVPLSIVKKEMLPKLAQNPNYFADHGYETVERNGELFVRQPPGDSNALGHIKFMFPNRFSVYLHDTNARSLFGRGERALSHGCVRVDQPFKLAEIVLGPDRGWSERRLSALVGGDERTINLARPLPVHIDYFTAFVDERGELQLRDDVYGYSARVRTALGLDG